MTYNYTIYGENGRVGGSNKDIQWIFKERDTILKTIFPNYVFAGIVDNDPNHIVYEFNGQKVYFKVEEDNENG